MIRRPPRSTLLPDTTIFRSAGDERARLVLARGGLDEAGRVQRVEPALERREPEEVFLLLLARERDLVDRARVVRSRQSTPLNSIHANISYAVFSLKTPMPSS